MKRSVLVRCIRTRIRETRIALHNGPHQAGRPAILTGHGSLLVGVVLTMFGLAACSPLPPAEEYAALVERLEASAVPVVSIEEEEGTWGNTLRAVVQMDAGTSPLTAWVYVAELHREVFLSCYEPEFPDLDCLAFAVLDGEGGTIEEGDILIRDYDDAGFGPPLSREDDEVLDCIQGCGRGRDLAIERTEVWRDARGFRRAAIHIRTFRAQDILGRLEIDEFREDLGEEFEDAHAQVAVLYVNVDDLNGEPLLRYVCDFESKSETAGYVDGIQPWWPLPVEGNYGSSSLIEPEVPFDFSISGGEQYMLGELVRYGQFYSNPSSRPVTIDPYPPAGWVKSLDRDVIVFSSEGGERTREVDAGYRSGPSFGHWWQDEEVDAGQEITPGMYEITQVYVVRDNVTGKVHTVTHSFQFELVAPASARTGDQMVDQSVTAEGMTVTLEHMEMDALGVTVYTFTTPPGYELPEHGPPYEYELFGAHSRAEYSIDVSPGVELKGSGGKFTAEGITLAWDGIEPIPVDAREFSFTVTRLGDVEGRWEFMVEFE